MYKRRITASPVAHAGGTILPAPLPAYRNNQNVRTAIVSFRIVLISYTHIFVKKSQYMFSSIMGAKYTSQSGYV